MQRDPTSEARQIGFLLLPEFPLYALIPAIEALRLANQNRGRRLYDWRLVSVDGRAVPAGNAMVMPVNTGIAGADFLPTLIVVAGNHPLRHITRPVLNWLRRLDRHGALLGAIDTGLFALAEAGLIGGRTVTLHWEAIAMFRERHPNIAVSEQILVIDRNRMSCAGGHAALDMMLHVIAQDHGAALAQRVANGFVQPTIRHEADPQRASIDTLLGDRRAEFSRVLGIMEANFSSPLDFAALCRESRLGPHRLGSVVREATGLSPMRCYLKLRLAGARTALFYGDGRIEDIAGAFGFSCPEVFSRAFKAEFGTSPRGFRNRFSREQLLRFRPEMHDRIELG
jgi:AraC family transcriptional regulator, carnitine catabolism transcriptional activator